MQKALGQLNSLALKDHTVDKVDQAVDKAVNLSHKMNGG